MSVFDTGWDRGLRGGSWGDHVKFAGGLYPPVYHPLYRCDDLGLRLVRRTS